MSKLCQWFEIHTNYTPRFTSLLCPTSSPPTVSYVVHWVQPLPVRHTSHIHAGVMVCVLQCLAEGLTSCSTEASRLGLSVARRERVSFIHCPSLRPLATPGSTRSSRFARPEASLVINLHGVLGQSLYTCRYTLSAASNLGWANVHSLKLKLKRKIVSSLTYDTC